MTTVYDFLSFGLEHVRKFLQKKEKTISVFVFGLDNAGKTTLLNRIKNLNDSNSPKKQTPNDTKISIESNDEKKHTKKSNTKIPDEVSPTKGINVYNIQVGKKKYILFELGGQRQLRHYWREYFDKNVDCCMWVIDGADVREDESTKLFNMIFSRSTTPFSSPNEKKNKKKKKPQKSISGDSLSGENMTLEDGGGAKKRPMMKIPFLVFVNKCDLVLSRKNNQKVNEVIGKTVPKNFSKYNILRGSAKTGENVAQCLAYFKKRK